MFGPFQDKEVLGNLSLREVAKAETMPVEAGSIEVSASVTVVFALKAR